MLVKNKCVPAYTESEAIAHLFSFLNLKIDCVFTGDTIEEAERE